MSDSLSRETPAIGGPVTVRDVPDGRIELVHEGRPLSYRIFDKERWVTQASIVENKRLGEVLARVKEQQQARLDAAQSAPKRRGRKDQASGPFKERERSYAEVLREAAARPIARAGPLRFLRRVSKALSVQHKRVRYTIVGYPDPNALVGRDVDVIEENGVVTLEFEGQQLKFQERRLKP